MSNRIKYVSLIILMGVILSSACYVFVILDNVETVQRDYWPTEGWRKSSPEEHGLSQSKLDEMRDFLISNEINVHNLLVIRDGYIVYEEVINPGFSTNTSHLLYSVTKSFTSCLLGIAMDKGYITDLDQPMLDFFEDKVVEIDREAKEGITLQHLLTMRSGVFWNEDISQPNYGIPGLEQGDGVSYALNLPMVAEPGEQWFYNTGSSHILSGVIQEATGMTTYEFGVENLFTPLGFGRVSWSKDSAGTYLGGFHLVISPRDMAKFGFLFLNNGVWDGEQIVSSTWVEESTSTFTDLNSVTGYGYQWWTMPNLGAYCALGLYGQAIFVMPDEDIVFVMTSRLDAEDGGIERYLFANYVVESIINSYDDTS